MANRRRRSVGKWLIAPILLRLFRALRRDEGPEFLAGGFALGVALACFPLFILHLPLVLLLASALGLSRLGGLAGVMLANPVTAPPLYAFEFAVGAALMPGNPDSPLRHPARILEDPSVLSAVGADDVTTLLVGASVVAVPAGLLARALALRWAGGYVARRAARKAKREARRLARAEHRSTRGSDGG